MEVLKWARAKGCPWDEMTCSSATEGGHLEVLKWARANGGPWDATTCIWAKRRGHSVGVGPRKWLSRNMVEVLFFFAATGKNLGRAVWGQGTNCEREPRDERGRFV